ncbi:MAG: polysaccharide deacetylase family protein [Actinobacteria bacterium]|nr:polysaccharide deacetylase family protein [Actinomycetota bacterium]
MNKQVIVTTSWDDGHKLDLKLAKILNKYGIRGTFYISPKNREISQENLLSDDEIINLSRDFEIGAHTMTHPRLTKIPDTEALREIIDSKKYLEKLIDKEVPCFCYPGGRYNKRIIRLVEKAGFRYSRTMQKFKFDLTDNFLLSGTTLEAHRNSLITLPLDSLKILAFSKFNLMEFFKNLHWEHLAKKTFDYIEKHGGVYHLWGHSWVIEKSNCWEKIEQVLLYISNKTNVKYYTNIETFNVIK